MVYQNKIILKKGRERPVLKRHPWIFSGAVDRVEGNPVSGEPVKVLDTKGEFLAWGAFSPQSQIRARLWSWDPQQEISPEFLFNRIAESLAHRKTIGFDFPMMRLVHAESDGIPGLIVDKYEDILVVQFLSAGVEIWKDEITKSLAEITEAKTIFERSDGQVRELEGLPKYVGVLHGLEPKDLITIEEDEVKTLIDIRKGHKTGYYIDQRENRKKIATFCQDKTVLDCFCYSGGFSVRSLKEGAKSVTLVDESKDALELAVKNAELNNLDQGKITTQQGDVFQVLRKYRDQGAKFDVIILDPPKFAPTASFADKAARGYKDINLLAFKLLNPGGLLATFSCSGGISRDLFLRILSGAALDARVNARIQVNMGQSADHSINLSFPEGIYLKGFGIRVD